MKPDKRFHDPSHKKETYQMEVNILEIELVMS